MATEKVPKESMTGSGSKSLGLVASYMLGDNFKYNKNEYKVTGVYSGIVKKDEGEVGTMTVTLTPVAKDGTDNLEPVVFVFDSFPYGVDADTSDAEIRLTKVMIWQKLVEYTDKMAMLVASSIMGLPGKRARVEVSDSNRGGGSGLAMGLLGALLSAQDKK